MYCADLPDVCGYKTAGAIGYLLYRLPAIIITVSCLSTASQYIRKMSHAPCEGSTISGTGVSAAAAAATPSQ